MKNPKVFVGVLAVAGIVIYIASSILGWCP